MSGYDDFNQPIIDEFRANGGTVATNGFGDGLVLLHHTGAKSGAERVSPVRGLRIDDDTWLVAASKGGAPENPAWYHNLLAHPDVTIETGDAGSISVHAENLTGARRADAWKTFTAASPGFLDYEKRTSRVIPVIELRRR
ncbi:nitroreductase/quinone reductase family protein [Humibacter sp. RRB41]|uniref:nitroreductase/quinone reductase family protein n=1 Tax=Humibacter sp. RRB41 TaxID=2919946 RepID=UPI001FAA02E4|nr:nitroreductase/quinone reductase family protein [Humibacter sp. RRB41]